MNVKELIAKLATLDPNMAVTVDGYEGGVTENIHIYPVRVRCNVNDEGFYGEHEAVWSDDQPFDKVVLRLSRNSSIDGADGFLYPRSAP